MLREAKGQGIEVALDEYVRVRDKGGNAALWDPKYRPALYNSNSGLERFLARVHEIPERNVALFQMTRGDREVASASIPIDPKKGVPADEKAEFEQAIAQFHKLAEDPHADPEFRALATSLQFPDPVVSPEMYRLYHEGGMLGWLLGRKRLLVLWGCTQHGHNPVAPLEAARALRIDSWAWLKRWWKPSLLLFALVVATLIWWLWPSGSDRYQPTPRGIAFQRIDTKSGHAIIGVPLNERPNGIQDRDILPAATPPLELPLAQDRTYWVKWQANGEVHLDSASVEIGMPASTPGVDGATTKPGTTGGAGAQMDPGKTGNTGSRPAKDSTAPGTKATAITGVNRDTGDGAKRVGGGENTGHPTTAANAANAKDPAIAGTDRDGTGSAVTPPGAGGANDPTKMVSAGGDSVTKAGPTAGRAEVPAQPGNAAGTGNPAGAANNGDKKDPARTAIPGDEAGAPTTSPGPLDANGPTNNPPDGTASGQTKPAQGDGSAGKPADAGGDKGTDEPTKTANASAADGPGATDAGPLPPAKATGTPPKPGANGGPVKGNLQPAGGPSKSDTDQANREFLITLTGDEKVESGGTEFTLLVKDKRNPNRMGYEVKDWYIDGRAQNRSEPNYTIKVPPDQKEITVRVELEYDPFYRKRQAAASAKIIIEKTVSGKVRLQSGN